MSAQIPLEICSIFKNEAKYLQEFIEFHLIVGFTKFHLYNNNSTDNYLEVLLPYINNGIVDLIQWPYPVPCQVEAYQHFINQNNKRPVWCAFLDVDEFMFSPRTDMNLLDMFNMSQKPFAVAVNWRCFGNSGLNDYDPRPVIERFTYRPAFHEPDKHIKSIIRLDQTVKTSNDPHFFWCETGTFNEQFNMIVGPFAINSCELFRINHYVTKSKNEYIEKRKRGRADFITEGMDWELYDSLSPMDIHDTTIQRFLPELKNRLKI
jgi:Glycosyltransferase family 92